MQANNRAISLAGANEILEVIGASAEQSELGFYEIRDKGGCHQARTLKAVLHELITSLANQ